MRPVVIVLPYYKNPGILRVHQENWARYPDRVRKNLKVIIVDDGSPTGAAIDAVQPCDYELQIYRVLKDIPWHQNGARNLGMHVAPDGWVLVTDIDHVLEPAHADALARMSLNPMKYYVPARRLMPEKIPYKRHPNSYILTREMYWRAGGMDEDFCGWYGSDSTFRRQIALVGRRCEVNTPSLLLYGRNTVADASTTDFGRKDTKWHSSNNPELRAKRNAGIKATNPIRFEWERVR